MIYFLLLLLTPCLSHGMEHKEHHSIKVNGQEYSIPINMAPFFKKMKFDFSPPLSQGSIQQGIKLLETYDTLQSNLNSIQYPELSEIKDTFRQQYIDHWQSHLQANPFQSQPFNLNHPTQYWRCKILTDHIPLPLTIDTFTFLERINAPAELLCSVYNRLYDQNEIPKDEQLKHNYLLSFDKITWFGDAQNLVNIGLRSFDGIDDFCNTLGEDRIREDFTLNAKGFWGVNLSNNHIQDISEEQLAIINKNKLVNGLMETALNSASKQFQEDPVGIWGGTYRILLHNNQLNETTKERIETFNKIQTETYKNDTRYNYFSVIHDTRNLKLGLFLVPPIITTAAFTSLTNLKLHNNPFANKVLIFLSVLFAKYALLLASIHTIKLPQSITKWFQIETYQSKKSPAFGLYCKWEIIY